MNIHRTVIITRISAAVLLLLATLFLSIAQAGPALQGADPRPDRGGGGGGSGGGGGGAGGGGAGGIGGGAGGNGGSTQSGCASISGQVINWGVGGIGGVATELSTGSWRVSTTSASDGNYGYGGLGVGIARLHVSLPPALSDSLEPFTRDAAIYLNCDYPIIANQALLGDSEIEPPATLEMSAPARLNPAGDNPIRLTVRNDLPNEITNVIVTNLMPPGLIAQDVAAASVPPEDAMIVDSEADGQLVVVYLDTVPAGTEANIIITVTVDEDVPNSTQIKNKATLFYRESIAVQTLADLTIGSSSRVVPAAATPAVPVAAQSSPTSEPDASPTPTSVLEPTTEPTTEREDGEAFVPPDDLPGTGGDEAPEPLLPVTGQNERRTTPREPGNGLGPILPLGWLTLLGLAVLTYHLRSRRHR